MSYPLRESQTAIWAPFLPWLQATASFLAPPGSAPSALPTRQIAAGCDLLVRLYKRYPKPEFGLTDTIVDGQRVAVTETVVLDPPFCRLRTPRGRGGVTAHDQGRGRSPAMWLKEQQMNTDQKSLRWLIDKWLAPTPAMPVRLTRYGRAGSIQGRCVRAESLRPTGSLAIFFFRHDDGSWNVFPARPSAPAMCACRLAA